MLTRQCNLTPQTVTLYAFRIKARQLATQLIAALGGSVDSILYLHLLERIMIMGIDMPDPSQLKKANMFNAIIGG